MSELTRILSAIDNGDPHVAAHLLPLVYRELRILAAAKLTHEKPGQTLDATALVHEAYLRLARGSGPGASEETETQGGRWKSRGHFFAAAAEAMRRILIDNARRKKCDKHGGGRRRVELGQSIASPSSDAEQLLALDEALTRLNQHDVQAASLVKLRYFAGLSVEDAAETLGISRASAYRHWKFARAWLLKEMGNRPHL